MSARRSRLVAATMRKSTSLPARSRRAGVTTRSSSTRSSLTCIDSGVSSISSRNTVPPARRHQLAVVRWHGAGERAARVAEQLGLHQLVGDRGAVDRARSGSARARDQRVDVARAMTSLPVPVSPVSSTGIDVARRARDLAQHRAAPRRCSATSVPGVRRRRLRRRPARAAGATQPRDGVRRRRSDDRRRRRRAGPPRRAARAAIGAAATAQIHGGRAAARAARVARPRRAHTTAAPAAPGVARDARRRASRSAGAPRRAAAARASQTHASIMSVIRHHRIAYLQ